MKLSIAGTLNVLIDADHRAIPVSISMDAREALGLLDKQPLPAVGSPEWVSGLERWATPDAWGIEIEGVTVSMPNPAHRDDATPLFPEHEPSPVLTWKVA